MAGEKTFFSERLHTIREHLFTGFKEGWMSAFGKYQQPYKRIVIWIAISIFIVFIWIAINAPSREWRQVGIIYALLGLFSFSISGLQFANPKSLPEIAGTRFVGDFGVVGDMAFGALTVLVALLFSSFLSFVTGTPMYYSGKFVAFPKRWLVNLMVVGFMIPIFEETFFSIIQAPITESYGVVPGVVVVSLAFPAFHWAVYGYKWGILLYLFLWRLTAAFTYALTRCWGASAYAHIIINSSVAIRLTVLKEVPPLPYISTILGVLLLLIGPGIGLYLRRMKRSQALQSTKTR